MYKIITYLISIVFSLILFFVILFTSTEIIGYNLNYYKWHYINRNIEADTGMDINDLMETTERLIDYLKGKSQSLDFKATINGEFKEVFNEREKLHMVDVQDLALGAKKIRDYGFVFLVIIFIVLLFLKQDLFIKVMSSIKYVFSIAIGLILLLSILIVIDFNKYFTIFHEIFFDNDLWLLDPQKDILINIVPEIFFFTTAVLIIILFLILSFIIIFSFELIKKKIILNNR